MVLFQNQLKNKLLFNVINNYNYPFLEWFYNIQIIGSENISTDDSKPIIYISKHSSHNYELIMGLFLIYKYSKIPIRGLGHYLINYICFHYKQFGVIVGSRYNAELLLKNNEHIYILPGGGEEMATSILHPNKINWYSMSGNYRTGYAQLSEKYNADIILVTASNIENMIFSPLMYIALKLKLFELLDYLFVLFENRYIIYFKLFISILLNMFVIPISVPITFYVNKPIKKRSDESVLDFAIRCESLLQQLHLKVN